MQKTGQDGLVQSRAQESRALQEALVGLHPPVPAPRARIGEDPLRVVEARGERREELEGKGRRPPRKVGLI